MRKGDDLITFIVPKVKKIRSLNLPEALGPPGLSRDTFTLPSVPNKRGALGISFFFFATHARNFMIRLQLTVNDCTHYKKRLKCQTKGLSAASMT